VLETQCNQDVSHCFIFEAEAVNQVSLRLHRPRTARTSEKRSWHAALRKQWGFWQWVAMTVEGTALFWFYSRITFRAVFWKVAFVLSAIQQFV